MAVSIRAAAGRLLGAWLVALCLTASGCSSPTEPSPPPSPPTPEPSSLTITCPPSITASTTNGAPVPVTFANPTTAGGRPPIAISCSRTSGSLFPLGATTVQCSATDATATIVSCSFTVTVTSAPQLSRTRFLAFGDSFTEGEVTVPSSSPTRDPYNFVFRIVPEASYPTRLSSLLLSRYPQQASTLSVVNSGRAGEWAEEGARRLPGVMANVRPDVLLLLEGVNELAALGAPGVSRAIAALDTMAKEGRNRGARVFLAMLPPSRPSGPRAVPAPTILALNDRIRTLAAGEGAVLVDLHAALSADVTRYIGIDGLHPTEAGYLRMAEVFFEAIRAALEVR
jgi:lysophospholipase L1-like esterase